MGVDAQQPSASDIATHRDRSHLPIAALWLLTITAYGTWFYGFGVLLDDMRVDLGTTDRVLATAFALAQLLTGVFGVGAGHALDRWGPRPVFLVGATLGAGLTASSTLLGDPMAFVVVYGAGGGIIGACGFYGVTQTVAARLVTGRETRSIARLTVWGAFSSPILIPATEAARRAWGWRPTVVLASASVAVSFALAAAIAGRSTTPTARTPFTAALGRFARQPSARRLAGSAALSSASVAVLLVYQVPVMKSLGVAASTAASIAAARGLAQLLGRLPLTWVVRRLGERVAVRSARVGVAVGAMALLAISAPVMPVIYVVIVGTAIGALSPLDGIFSRSVLGDTGFGTLMGVLALTGGIASAVGPLVAATIVDLSGWRPAAVVFAASLALLAAWTTPRPPAGSEVSTAAPRRRGRRATGFPAAR